VLPPDTRKAAKNARRGVESKREEAERVRTRGPQSKAPRPEEPGWTEVDFEFQVAGAQYEGRDQIVARFVTTGMSVRLVPEPRNPFDPNAVQVNTADGRMFGYVPKRISSAVAHHIGTGWFYSARVTEILADGGAPVPLIALPCVRADQGGSRTGTATNRSSGAHGSAAIELLRDAASAELTPRTRCERVNSEEADEAVAQMGHGEPLYTGTIDVDPTLYVATADGLIVGRMPEPYAGVCTKWTREGGTVQLQLFEFPEPAGAKIYCGIYLR